MAEFLTAIFWMYFGYITFLIYKEIRDIFKENKKLKE